MTKKQISRTDLLLEDHWLQEFGVTGDDKTEVMHNLRQMIDDQQGGHTDLQMDHFIINSSGVTPWGKWHQVLREVYKRIRGANEQSYEVQKAKLELQLQDITVNEKEELFTSNSTYASNKFEIEYKLAVLEKEKMRRDLFEKEKSYKETIRELVKFYQIAVDCYKEIEGKDPVELEREFWQVKFVQDAHHQIFGNVLGVSTNLVEAINSLPIDVRDRVFNSIIQTKNNIMQNLQGTPLVNELTKIKEEVIENEK